MSGFLDRGRGSRQPRSGFRIHLPGVLRYGFASIIPRGLAIATALLLMPLTIDRLGVREYAIWLLATQIPSLVASPDLGIGQAVINDLSATYRRYGNLTSERRRLLGVTRLLGVLAVAWFVAGAVGAGIYSTLVASNQFLHVFAALAIGLLCFVSGIPASIWPRAQLAQERGHVGVLWEGIGKLGALICCLLVLFAAPNVLLLIVAFLLPTTLSLWINATIFIRGTFSRTEECEKPSLREALRENMRSVRIGRLFVVMQLGYLISTALDPYLVNWFLSPGGVTAWSVTKRPFDLMPLAVSLYSTALWPVFSRLHADRAYRSAKWLILGTTCSSAAIVIVGGIAVYQFSGPLYGYLGAGVVNVHPGDLLWFTVSAVASATSMVLAIFLNGVGAIRAQAYMLVASACLISVLKVAALRLGDLHDFIWATGVGTFLFGALPMCVLTVWTLRKQFAAPRAIV